MKIPKFLFDCSLEKFQDGIEMFNGEVTLTSVLGDPKRVEITWDEIRDNWSEEIINALKEEALCM